MKHILLIALAFSFGACYNKKIDGQLDVLRPLTLKSKNGKVTLRPNNYEAKLKLKTKRKFQLVVPGPTTKKFTFKVPRGIEIPRNNGSLRLRRSEVKQPVDVALDFDTEVSRSEERQMTESCSRTITRRVCRRVHKPARRVCRERDGRRTCRTIPARTVRECRNEPRTVYGTRDVTYQNVYRVRNFNAELLDSDTQETLANFSGRKTSNDRDYLYRSACHINHYPGTVY